MSASERVSWPRGLSLALLVATSPIYSIVAQQVDTALWTRLHYRFVGPE